jgi:RNA polymerase sigma-70 factor, ECF subfamily
MRTQSRHLDGPVGLDQLAARLADGYPLAPRELVELHYVALYRYAFSVLRDERAAEDAVQDAFERALGALGRCPEERLRTMKLRPWMYRITLNVARNRLRRRREEPVGEVSAVVGAGGDENREGIMDVLAALGRCRTGRGWR